MKDSHDLGELQLAVMRVLWARGEAGAADVHAALIEERGLALTTIKTTLRKLEDRGVVTHRENGRQFIYRPATDEADVREGMVGDLVRRMFAGNSAALLNHLVEAGEVDAASLDALREKVRGERKNRRKEKR